MTHSHDLSLQSQYAARWSCTETENRLREHVSDSRLRASLTAIRQTVDYIWGPDTPRMIEDAIDRDMEYCKRIAELVERILVANDGRMLSVQEMYLLLAGIYLHGVGLQTDVMTIPEIRKKAEQLGAQFGTTESKTRSIFSKKPQTSPLGRLRDAPYRTSPVPLFLGESGSSVTRYNLEQQKAIRKNYHYLSASWVDYANQSGETSLGPAAMTIPRDLVDDLIDVCIYHTRLPITDCPVTFTFDPSGRKQLITALIRFAIELNVSLNRVPLESISTYPLEPRSLIYWWMHHRTTMTFRARNVIRLTTVLHADDIEPYGSLIHKLFITEFQNKNAPVINILRSNGIPIGIDAHSSIVASEHAEPLPPPVVHALQSLREGRGPLLELADEVRTWLVATQYEVSDPKQSNDRVVMRASLQLGSVRHRLLLSCIRGQITPSDIDAMEQMLTRRVSQGWIISDSRVSDLARRRAATDDSVEVFHLADFLHQKIWAPYFDTLTAIAEIDRIPDRYVDIGGTMLDSDDHEQYMVSESFPSLTDYIDTWLQDDIGKHITITGDYGSGKTWLCRFYAYRQMKRYLKNPTRERLPLLITLRDFPRLLSVRQLINEALLERYKLPFIGSAYDVFTEMNRRGKLLLLLDGFDEMSRDDSYASVANNFKELVQLLDDHSKMILTCRADYFRWTKPSFRSSLSNAGGATRIELPSSDFTVLAIEPCTDEQITRIISRRLGKHTGAKVAKEILAQEHVQQIARKPLVTEFLLTCLEDIQHIKHTAHAYLYATNRLLIQAIETHNIFATTADKLYFLCELAWEMLSSGEFRLHYSNIPERITQFFGNRSAQKHDLDTWDLDLRNQTLLRHNAAGYYEFYNKSLVEYFVAYKFAAELGCLAPEFTHTYKEADGSPCEMKQSQKHLRELLATFGKIAFDDERMHAVSSLLAEMVGEATVGRLWKLIDRTRRKTPEQVQSLCSNAVTLLHMIGTSFRGASLANTVLHRANLVQADLEGANLEQSMLIGVNLSGANLCRANLRGAFLRATNLFHCNLEQADMRGADLVFTPVWPCDALVLCEGLNMTGARGLDQEITCLSRDGTQNTVTLKQFFLERGAIIE